jgi:Zn-dependent membrane protease YugP
MYTYGHGMGGSGLSWIVPYLLLLVLPGLLGLWATFRVRSQFAKASRVGVSSGLSGAEVATEILRAHNLDGVRVEATHGFLSDHYDPKAKVLRLSQDVYQGRSAASVAVAAHEAGHALQDADHYAPLKLRSAIVPVASFGGMAAQFAIMAGMVAMWVAAPFLGKPLLLVGILGLCCVALFQLITLPVEFDASRRAKDLLVSTGIVQAGPEAAAMHKTLNAAALTYVAALVSTIGTILYYLLILLNSNRRN